MGTRIEKTGSGETYYYSLTDYVKRGMLYGAKNNEGTQIIVYHGSPLGYPMGDSVLQISKENIPDLIALLKAVISHK